MFNMKNHDRSPSWYPGAQVIRDRWGTAIGPRFGGREFRPQAEAPSSVVNHLRWSLGLM